MKRRSTTFILTASIAFAQPVHAETWQCRDSTGHIYKVSQSVPNDHCSIISQSNPYPPDPIERHVRKPGARIGMTQEEVVLRTSWGRPESVSRTTNRYGTREQWVYGGGNYLYFEDGILTSIQN